VPGRPDVSLSPAEVRHYLADQRTGVLATNGPGGFPHQMAMWYLPEDDRLLMWTYGRSQKAANLRRDPRASFLVEDGDTYPTLRGVLVQGTAELVADPAELLRVGISLRLRYHPGSDIEEARVALASQAPKRVIIVLPVSRVISWDHRKLA
jgi:PPOX class probable F420-dependent enzyme